MVFGHAPALQVWGPADADRPHLPPYWSARQGVSRRARLAGGPLLPKRCVARARHPPRRGRATGAAARRSVAGERPHTTAPGLQKR